MLCYFLYSYVTFVKLHTKVLNVYLILGVIIKHSENKVNVHTYMISCVNNNTLH